MARARKAAGPPPLPAHLARACYCGHPEARHWTGAGDYPRMCLHRQITGELCLCLDYADDPAAGAALAA